MTANPNSPRLRIAMQKTGRLSSESQSLLKQCGVKINLCGERLLAYAENLPIDILRVRDDDSPGLVFDGVVDWGILGENVLEEAALARLAAGETADYTLLRRLDFGGCRLALAIPRDETYRDAADLAGRRIAPSNPQRAASPTKPACSAAQSKSHRGRGWRMRSAIWFRPGRRWKPTACAKWKPCTALTPA